jgi:bifunctional N-acetylglucosamine-1-phosphate-uridyltransferase/glucosamine-1-phosphate-acetyltransferase GlmU-like protein
MFGAIILAGGKGKRMESALPKPLHTLGEQTLIKHTLLKVIQLPITEVAVVVGWKAEEVISSCPNFGVKWVFQKSPLGNGDALALAVNSFSPSIKDVITLQVDDSAFYKLRTLDSLMEMHATTNVVASLMTVEKEGEVRNSTILREGYHYLGRQYYPENREGVEFFSGCACFDVNWLRDRGQNIPMAKNGEYMLTELFNMALEEGEKVKTYPLSDTNEWFGINCQKELELARSVYERR